MVTTMPTMQTPLATLIANEMEARNWTQRSLAEAAGMSNHVTVGNILRGKTAMPDIDTLASIARAFETPSVSAAEYFSRLVRAAGYSVGEERADEVLERLGSLLSERQREQLARLSTARLAQAINLILGFAASGDPDPPDPPDPPK